MILLPGHCHGPDVSAIDNPLLECSCYQSHPSGIHQGNCSCSGVTRMFLRHADLQESPAVKSDSILAPAPLHLCAAFYIDQDKMLKDKLHTHSMTMMMCRAGAMPGR